MEKTYRITDEKFGQAMSLIVENGGNVYADGRFEVSGVKGKFQKTGDIIKIVITEKPWLASWGMIESKLNDFFQ